MPCSNLVFKRALLPSASVLVTVLVAACSSKASDTASSGGVGAMSTAAAVAGAADTHCAGQPVVVVDPAVCHNPPPADPDAGAMAADGGATPMAEFGATLYNSEGDDDDCKYHVKWQSTTVAANADVTLSLSATTLSDNKPLAGAKPYAEIYLNDTHGAPNTPVATAEVSPGNYTIGPVRFDARGTWTVRFHFRSDCDDSPTSPHGHVAFLVNVP
jgi:hypothetical protein